MLTDTWLEQTDFITFSLGELEEEEGQSWLLDMSSWSREETRWRFYCEVQHSDSVTFSEVSSINIDTGHSYL